MQRFRQQQHSFCKSFLKQVLHGSQWQGAAAIFLVAMSLLKPLSRHIVPGSPKSSSSRVFAVGQLDSQMLDITAVDTGAST